MAGGRRLRARGRAGAWVGGPVQALRAQVPRQPPGGRSHLHSPTHPYMCPPLAKQTYTASPANVRVADGKLLITSLRGADGKYTSGRVDSRPSGAWYPGMTVRRPECPRTVAIASLQQVQEPHPLSASSCACIPPHPPSRPLHDAAARRASRALPARGSLAPHAARGQGHLGRRLDAAGGPGEVRQVARQRRD